MDMKRVRLGLVLVFSVAGCAMPPPSPSLHSDAPNASPSIETHTGSFEAATCPDNAIGAIGLPSETAASHRGDDHFPTLGTFSRVAFEVMRREPDHVRSVVLDTPSLPQVDMFTEAIVGTRASLSVLSATCRADSRCDESYPDLESTMATAQWSVSRRRRSM